MLERYLGDNQESRSKRKMISKERIAPKMKKIRKDYKKAVADSGVSVASRDVLFTFKSEPLPEAERNNYSAPFQNYRSEDSFYYYSGRKAPSLKNAVVVVCCLF